MLIPRCLDEFLREELYGRAENKKAAEAALKIWFFLLLEMNLERFKH
ncbi:MAG: hypothetical protein MI673_01400 [Thiotrichales bacterium]|nr:hypothetical protein [Thiotrichales bacterium]